ncbi:hypothetical protein B5C34_00180 [Pacificimonas flava]|uniref:DUF3035 domain-containing protein n=2 Tax=Pacificimonas TaxID=1960290 RepID=A0A219B132_9SPHN|nr:MULTISPECIES: DUF3035 domain-containing protein [Pacificimonas]MBZ6380061.1 DUF3035 domain-containing protein [Pacificimonas aurantium]OWV32030.1 hypothetical protein B5C34_00180 [Pacificimonas flava]
MTRIPTLALIGMSAALLGACGGGSSLGNRQAPDELAVTRNAPLVIPPDFALEPPRPGAPRTIENEAQTQAMEALFGPGVRPPEASRSEQLLLEEAGAADPDPRARATAGDPDTLVIGKGSQLRDIVAAPEGTEDPAVAQVQTGG